MDKKGRGITTRALIFSLALNVMMGIALLGDPRQVWNFQDFCYKEMRFLYMRGCLKGTEREPIKIRDRYGWNINSPTHYCNERTKFMEDYMINRVDDMGKPNERRNRR